MELLSMLIGINYGVRRRADKAVIKRKAEAVRGRKVSVNAFSFERVAFAERRKKTVPLCLKVILFADGDNLIGGKVLCLLVIANDDRAFLLSFRKEGYTRRVTSANQSQRLIGCVVAVF